MDPLSGNRHSLAAGNPVSFVEVDGHRLAAIGPGNARKRPGPNGPPAGDAQLPDAGPSGDHDRTSVEREQLWDAQVKKWFPDGMTIPGPCQSAGKTAEDAEYNLAQCRMYVGDPGTVSEAFAEEFHGPCYASHCDPPDAAGRLLALGEAYLMVGGGFLVRGVAAVVGRVGRTLGIGRGATTVARTSRTAAGGVRAIGFAPGEGVSALTASRLQHGTMHLERAGLLPRWSATRSPGIIRQKLSPILEHPTATVDHVLGGAPVKGFIGDLGGQQVGVFVFKKGPFQSQLASSFIPSAKQLAKWGL